MQDWCRVKTKEYLGVNNLEFCSFLNAQPSRGMVAEYVQVYLSKKVSANVMAAFTAEFLRQALDR